MYYVFVLARIAWSFDHSILRYAPNEIDVIVYYGYVCLVSISLAGNGLDEW